MCSHKIRGSGDENAPEPWFSPHPRHALWLRQWQSLMTAVLTSLILVFFIGNFVEHAFVSAKEGLDIVAISILAVRICPQAREKV